MKLSKHLKDILIIAGMFLLVGFLFVGLFTENQLLSALCLGIIAITLSACAVNDFLRERISNPWHKRRIELPDEEPQSTYEAEQMQFHEKLDKVKIAVLIITLANIFVAYLSIVLSGIPQQAAIAAVLLLPMFALGIYLAFGKYITLHDSSQTEQFFGLIFGRERVCLIAHLIFPSFVWIEWIYSDYGSSTVLNYGKYILLCAVMSAGLIALFFTLSVEYKKSKWIAVIAVVVIVVYSLMFVAKFNEILDTSEPEVYECTVVDINSFQRLADMANFHRDYSLTVEIQDGILLDIYAPFDDWLDTEVGDSVTVSIYKGALGISRASIDF